MRKIIRNLLKKLLYKSTSKSCLSYYKEIIKANPHLAKPAKGENEWLKRWRVYDKNLSPLCYRIFSRYVEGNSEIIPLEYVASIVEPILTPHKYIFYYDDKNNFNKVLPNSFMPKVLLRNIDMLMLDGEYNQIDNIDYFLNNLQNKYDKIVLKPSRLASGKGVQILKRDFNGNLITKNGKKLSIAMLHEDYGANFLLQECLEQSEFMSQFNPSSVNTIRMTTYRDESGNIIVTSSIMRIGAKGSDVDNAHSGGKFCGISSNGKVGNYVCDWLGTKQTKYNGLDFENNNWIVPNFERIKQFAQNISKHIIHHDIVALDIALDKDNAPKLIEFNVGGFGAWAFLMGGHSVFSNMDEQIFKRCYKAYQQLEFYIWTPIHRNSCLRAL